MQTQGHGSSVSDAEFHRDTAIFFRSLVLKFEYCSQAASPGGAEITCWSAAISCLLALWFLGAIPCGAQVAPPPQEQQPVRHFVNGFWFDGKSFAPDDFYVENGFLTHTPSSLTNTVTVDLQGGFVVPPYGDAHEHNFDNTSNTPAVTAKYLHDGIFYAQGMTNVTSGARGVVVAGLVNTYSTIDVTYANGCLTAPEGHPKEIYESIANGFYYPATAEQRTKVLASHVCAGDAYWEIDSAEDLAKKWPAILAAKPDLIKIILADSENFTPDSHVHPQLGKGLDPVLVPLITARAHAAGLKVAAHIDTAADYHAALIGGVDEMGHLPGYGIHADESLGRYRISDADIALSAKRHIAVQATAGIYVDDQTPAADLVQRQASQTDNLRRLKAAGVPILVGSDHYGEDAFHEADYLHSLHLWTNLEMLTMWSVTTPQDIFPKRRIGELKPDCEASFLVLAANPLENWSAAHAIVDQWKQGHHLESTGAASAPKPVAETQDIRGDNFTAKLYLPKSGSSKLALVIIGGSEGHLYEADEIAPKLAALGYETLGIDYHDGFQGARRLAKIPIETFTHAVSWLREKRGVQRVVTIGESRGSEAALLAACYDPDISAVAAIVPSNVVWGGYGSDEVAKESAWTWDGHPLPFLGFPDNAPSGAAGFSAALEQQSAEPISEIPVERIKGPLFFAGSEADAIWPSAQMVRRLEDRLTNAQFAFAVKALIFPDASHRLLGTGASPTKVTYEIGGKNYSIAFGGTAEGTEKARNQTWQSLVDFLQHVAEPLKGQ